MHSEFTMITTMSVKNSIFIGEVFQIKVSDGIPNPLKVTQKSTCIRLKCLRGIILEEFACDYSLNGQSNECAK